EHGQESLDASMAVAQQSQRFVEGVIQWLADSQHHGSILVPLVRSCTDDLQALVCHGPRSARVEERHRDVVKAAGCVLDQQLVDLRGGLAVELDDAAA